MIKIALPFETNKAPIGHRFINLNVLDMVEFDTYPILFVLNGSFNGARYNSIVSNRLDRLVQWGLIHEWQLDVTPGNEITIIFNLSAADADGYMYSHRLSS